MLQSSCILIANSWSKTDEVPPAFVTYLIAVRLPLKIWIVESWNFSAWSRKANQIVFNSRTFIDVLPSSSVQYPDVLMDVEATPQPVSEAST